ncbi:hypothetical protein [Blautia sp. Marseille-P3087]|uniref:hypothetical protein n=1 Tax=Blautia sp. Marseille-P3087 TaxID=1917876 RepID=UPI000931673E|nr:hypothetical protein [Blautia sp. Marseille-P3087]
MKQEKLLFNEIEIKQPDSGNLGVSFDTTYTDDSGRPMSGVALVTPLFTVEAYSYKATDLTLQEMSQILQIVAKGNKFKCRYLSAYHGKWRTDEFYVGRGSLNVGSWKTDEEVYDKLTFNLIGVNPL